MENAILSKVTDEIIAQVKEDAAKAGITGGLDLIELTLDDDAVFEGIFKKPNRAIFERYVSMSSKKDGARASIAFVRDLILFPTFEDFQALLDARPALPISLGNELAKGMGMTDDAKKKSI